MNASSRLKFHARALPLIGGALWLGAAALVGCAPKQAGFAMPPTPVEVAVAKREAVTDRFEAVGTLEAGEEGTLVSEIDARVVSIPYREGEAVARGALIARLDDDQLRAEVARGEALREQSRVAFERVKSIVDQAAGSPQDLDNAAAALKVAEANLDLSRARLSKTRITAPFAGRVGARRVSVGTFLRAGQPITDIAQVSEMRAKFWAPERYLGELKQGSEVLVSTTAYPGYRLTGRIDVIDPVLDPATRNARITARLTNPEGRFRPGMSANVTVVLSTRSNAVTVSSEAVFVEGDQAYVYEVKPDSSVAKVPLTLGSREAGVVEVLRGLEPGAQVVRAGHQKLFEGARVMPLDPAAMTGGAAAAPGGKPGGKPGGPAPARAAGKAR
jgi:membrane fusion protein, multidrug efflux system